LEIIIINYMTHNLFLISSIYMYSEWNPLKKFIENKRNQLHLQKSLGKTLDVHISKLWDEGSTFQVSVVCKYIITIN